jgi:hypothetical protein
MKYIRQLYSSEPSSQSCVLSHFHCKGIQSPVVLHVNSLCEHFGIQLFNFEHTNVPFLHSLK